VTAEHIASVEVDPDKVVPQKDYSNDARPARPSPDRLFVEGVELVKKKDFAGAEAKLRQAVAGDANNAAAKAWLARALLGLGRSADAEKVAGEALAIEPVPLEAAAWANNVLGQAALAAGRQKDAVDRFQRAAAFAVESSALKAAHEGIIAAERVGGARPTIDDSVAKFFADFDRAVTSGVNTVQAEQYVDSAALPDFVKGLVTSVARTWKTEVLRSEMVGTDEALVDARFSVTISQRTGTAFATARLRRTGGAWRISDIQILETTESGTPEQ
jgi:tetratricopeptide (TPR) repeat protein